MKDLFTPLTRDERQEESLRKWLQAKGKGTVIACTGYGKTRVAINCFKRILTKYPTFKAIVVVPTDTLKEQWINILDSQGLSFIVKY
jgi:superfamily II DNA or RNA helicase